MLFYTKKFVLFFVVSFLLHLFFHRRAKVWPVLLLFASCYFYAQWDVKFLLLMTIVALSDFALGILIEEAKDPKKRKNFLIFSVAINLSVLGFFKYFNFFINSTIDLLNSFGLKANVPTLEIVLPIGISFFTFESLSYVIEVYRGHMKASRNFIHYYLFIAFFPHLVAGPIIQPKLLIQQFERGPLISGALFSNGLWRFFLGVSKKLLIADQIAYFVADPFYNNSHMFTGIYSVLGILGYSFQIYFDFSGYSDMAIGLARMLGFDLPENFNFPYLAQNIRDFWKRWHISLSTWLRDYLYFSLGGGRVPTMLKKYRNIFLTMLIGGFWHGASYNFIIWGALHGFYITISHILNDYLKTDLIFRKSFLNPFKIVTTFLMVSLAWVFFRSESLGQSISILESLLLPGSLSATFHPFSYFIFFCGICYHVLAYFKFFDLLNTLSSTRFSAATLSLASFFILVLILIFDNHFSPFIYFQF
jgi:D-alanyl-lipoteichoic acid acyltransferase DltB (MBOAT superfamily)